MHSKAHELSVVDAYIGTLDKRIRNVTKLGAKYMRDIK